MVDIEYRELWCLGQTVRRGRLTQKARFQLPCGTPSSILALTRWRAGRCLADYHMSEYQSRTALAEGTHMAMCNQTRSKKHLRLASRIFNSLIDNNAVIVFR